MALTAVKLLAFTLAAEMLDEVKLLVLRLLMVALTVDKTDTEPLDTLIFVADKLVDNKLAAEALVMFALLTKALVAVTCADETKAAVKLPIVMVSPRSQVSAVPRPGFTQHAGVFATAGAAYAFCTDKVITKPELISNIAKI